MNVDISGKIEAIEAAVTEPELRSAIADALRSLNAVVLPHVEGKDSGKVLAVDPAGNWTIQSSSSAADDLVNRNIISYSGSVDRVGQSAFRGCGQLVSVDLPGCLYVRQLAFRGCSALPEIFLPSCVSIQAEAFAYCSSLSRIVLLSDTMCVLDNANAFSGSPIANGAGTIEVPAALVDAYKADAAWGTYAQQIVAYEG